MFTDRWPRRKRWLVLSFAGAGLTMSVFLTRVWWNTQADPNDAFYRSPLWSIFADPFVMTFAIPAAIVSGLVAYGIARLWLDGTVMWKTATLMYGAAIVEALLVDPGNPFRVVCLAYPSLIAAAIVSRLLFKIPSGQPKE